MLPSLTKFDGGKRAGSSAVNAPPPHFRPLVGPLRKVAYHRAKYTTSEGLTLAQKSGLRYESKVQEYLGSTFGSYDAGPYIHFEDAGLARTAQPDGVLWTPYYAFIFEIKYQHMPEAWWQLEKLYRPLLEAFSPRHKFCLVEICRSYDPAQPFPCAVELVEQITSWVNEPRDSFGVFVWRR